MSICVTERTYKNFGRCIFLENGSAKLGVTIEKGPRIIYFALSGRSNIMFEDTGRQFTESAGEYGTWVAYGGHRLWCAPEVNPETYYPDNGSVEYDYRGSSLILSPPATSFGKKFEIVIEMDSSKPLVMLTHRIINVSDREAEFAPWSITSLTDGGVCIVPVSTRRTGYLPNRVMSLWDYTDIHDSRLRLSNTVTRITQDPFIHKAFKAGFNVEDGFIAYAVKDQIFAKCFAAYEDVSYPDYSCNVEVYTNNMFLECEVLGEKKKYAPGSTASITEHWCLFDDASGGLSEPNVHAADIDRKIKALLQ